MRSRVFYSRHSMSHAARRYASWRSLVPRFLSTLFLLLLNFSAHFVAYHLSPSCLPRFLNSAVAPISILRSFSGLLKTLTMLPETDFSRFVRISKTHSVKHVISVSHASLFIIQPEMLPHRCSGWHTFDTTRAVCCLHVNREITRVLSTKPSLRPYVPCLQIMVFLEEFVVACSAHSVSLRVSYSVLRSSKAGHCLFKNDSIN